MREVQEEVSTSMDDIYLSDYLLDPEKDDEKASEIVSLSREQLQHLISEQKLDRLTRLYVYDYFSHLERVAIHTLHIHARLEIVAPSNESFEANFLTLVNEADYGTPGTFYVKYVKK